MNIFEEYVYERFAAEMKSWPAEIRRDIYVIVIYLDFVNDDNRAAQIRLAHNTNALCQEETKYASSETEAKWNYAFWPSGELLICNQPFIADGIGMTADVDWKGVGLRDAYYTFARDYLQGGPVEAMINACAIVAQELHQARVVAEVCGQPVPVVFEIGNDFNNDDYRLQKIKEANPPGLVDEYLRETWG